MVTIMRTSLILVLGLAVGCFGLKFLKTAARQQPITLFAARKSTVQSKINTLHDLCPTLQIITNNTDSEIYKIANFLEKNSDHKLLAMDKLTNQRALSGRWLTIATTLPLSRIVPFSQMVILKAGSHLNDLPVTLGDIVQVIDTNSRTYENYVQFTVTSDTKQLKDFKATNQPCLIAGAVVSRGQLTFPCAADEVGNRTTTITNSSTTGVQNRIGIEFMTSELVPYIACTSINPGADALQQETLELRKALGIELNSSLSSPMPIKGWIDVTFMSNDGTTRITRGNNKNLFILKKLG